MGGILSTPCSVSYRLLPLSYLVAPWTGQLAFNKPSRDGFVSVDAPAQRVLLVDDVCTTGSRINSAAYALTAAGHQLAGTFMVARRFNIGYKSTPAFWEKLKAQKFTWEHSPLINGQQRTI